MSDTVVVKVDGQDGISFGWQMSRQRVQAREVGSELLGLENVVKNG